MCRRFSCSIAPRGIEHKLFDADTQCDFALNTVVPAKYRFGKP